MDEGDEPLALREYSYDDRRQTALFVFIGSRNGKPLAVSGMTPVTFGNDPRQSATDQSIKAAVKAVLEEAIAALADGATG